jgi:pyruvate formate lyase activating enzyme
MQADERISWESIRKFLLSRRGLLDGVVFSGGEPTLQPALMGAVQEVRAMDYRVGLHTAGMLPERFAELLPLLDWVGFDVKAPFDSYARITGVTGSGENALKSLRSLLASGVGYEVRTTVHPLLLNTEAMMELKATLLTLGVTNYAVQRYRAHEEHLPELRAAKPVEVPQDFSQGFSHFEFR